MPTTNASTQHPAGWSLLQWLIGHQVSLSILALCLWTAETAWRLPGDACYDLLNYHLYGPYSIFHGVWQRNIVPAQSQGFLSPLNDFYFYLLATRIEDVHTLNVLLALPEMVALSIGLVVTLHLLNAQSVVERLVALIAVLIGATGAATHPVLATSMSDMLPCGFALGCILLLMKNAQRTIDGKIHSAWADLVPGLLMGAAIGLKLTFAFTAVALIAAVFAWSGVYELIRARMAVVFCAGIALGILVSAGWWWMKVWQMTGSPIFPLYNTVFSSPMAGPFDYIDTRFLPHDGSHLVFNVFRWAISSKPIVTEADVPMRDPRMALALTASFMSLAIGVVRPSHDTDRTRFLAVFFLVAFVLWERQFSIFRYLSLLELLSGTMMATFGFSLLRGPAGRRAILAGGMLLLIVLKVYTIYPNWGRQAEPGGRFIQVNMPTLPPASLVLILDAAPLSYLAVLEPESVVFAGTNNNVTRPGDGGIFQRRISAAISGHAEQLFGLEKPDFDPGTADRTLNFYHLRRDDCTPVIGNIVGTKTMLCHLAQGHG